MVWQCCVTKAVRNETENALTAWCPAHTTVSWRSLRLLVTPLASPSLHDSVRTVVSLAALSQCSNRSFGSWQLMACLAHTIRPGPVLYASRSSRRPLPTPTPPDFTAFGSVVLPRLCVMRLTTRSQPGVLHTPPSAGAPCGCWRLHVLPLPFTRTCGRLCAWQFWRQWSTAAGLFRGRTATVSCQHPPPLPTSSVHRRHVSGKTWPTWQQPSRPSRLLGWMPLTSPSSQSSVVASYLGTPPSQALRTAGPLLLTFSSRGAALPVPWLSHNFVLP